jgi:D-xylose transport system substrate-binding protein
MLLAGGLLAAACGSSTSSSTTTTSGSSSASGTVSVTTFNKNFTTMANLKSVTAAGKGKIAVILPDTVSSARYTEFDAPYLAQAFAAAGLSTSDTIIQNAQGSDSTQLTDAQSDITSGASVLVVDPLDSGVGTSIETYAKAHGVPVVDYDRLVLGGSRQYYVSFDNVKVGTLIGQGMVTCVAAWKVAKPTLAVMVGSPTDNNATLFAQGYNAILKPLFSSGSYTLAASPAGTWDPPTALTEFQQAYTAHPSINAVLVPNDENAAPIPVTGQDATLVGLQNIISGYQCGTAYKPIYLEAQAAAALALYMRAGKVPPAGLVNGTVKDTVANVSVPSSLLHPEWVTPVNMESTVIADNFVPASQLCAGAYAADCTTYGIH